MNTFYPEIKKNFGFGMMRLPMNGSEVDIPQTCAMVDAFLEAGFNYFDTAHGYIGGKSELAVKECLTSRYPRDSYILTDKLSPNFFNTEADIRPYFASMLEACGVEYFDFYLLHNVNDNNIEYELREDVGKKLYVYYGTNEESIRDELRLTYDVVKKNNEGGTGTPKDGMNMNLQLLAKK